MEFLKQKKLKKEQKLLVEVLLNDPASLKYYKHRINHRFYLKFMNSILGRHIGLEIENYGAGETYYQKNGESVFKCQSRIKKEYRFVSYESEFPYAHKTEFAEQRIRLNGYKSAAGLHKWLCWCMDNLIVPTGSANHYHIDFTKEANMCLRDPHVIMECYNLSERQHEVDFLVSQVFDYKGTYNERWITKYKSGVISYRCGFNTFEFRMGRCTFNYKRIMKEAICSTIWVESVSKRLPLPKKLVSEIMGL
jgi:hypothetical protein